MSDDQNTGPSPETFRYLKGMIPSLAKGLAQKKISKNRPPKPVVASPTKYCEICVKLFDRKFNHEGEIESAVCPDCQAKLTEGFTAFRTPDRYCFGKSSALADMAGKIVDVKEATMNKLEEQFKSSKKEVKPDHKAEPQQDSNWMQKAWDKISRVDPPPNASN